MSEYVLFSPVGFSDPTRGYHDGAMIHICRYYKPQKVYLFLSKEMCDFDAKDNRYEVYINKLCQALGLTCSVEKIKRPDLTDAHEFDIFYDEFTVIIEQIHNKYPKSKILLNVSSGTTQMKSALNLVSSLSKRPVIALQVAGPEKKSNTSSPVSESYNIEEEWIKNRDNYEETRTKRILKPDNKMLNALLKRDLVSSLTAAYDYKAASLVAETIREYLDPRMIHIVKAGELRNMLKIEEADRLAKAAGYDLLPIRSEDYSKKAMICFEYILSLKLKLAKGELADFVRAVSPVLTDLFELYLEKQCALAIESYYRIDGRGGKRRPILARDALPRELQIVLDEAFKEGYRDKEPSAAVLYPFIQARGRKKVIYLARRLRNFEGDVRNIAAHEIVAVTEEWIKEKVGLGTADILKMLQDFLSCCISFPQDYWNSYDELNRAIDDIPIPKKSPFSEQD